MLRIVPYFHLMWGTHNSQPPPSSTELSLLPPLVQGAWLRRVRLLLRLNSIQNWTFWINSFRFIQYVHRCHIENHVSLQDWALRSSLSSLIFLTFSSFSWTACASQSQPPVLWLASDFTPRARQQEVRHPIPGRGLSAPKGRIVEQLQCIIMYHSSLVAYHSMIVYIYIYL